jgi:hypothetical protein
MPSQDFASTPATADITYGNVRPQSPPPAPTPPHAGFVHEMAAATGKPLPVAVLVCHGMGQQVRYETIGQLGNSILTAAKNQGCKIHNNGVELALQDDAFLARAELNWTDPAGDSHQVHIYEAYWAPITEGKVTYVDTIRFLFLSAWSGIRRSRLLRPAVFSRWMFGRMQDKMNIGPATQVSLLCVALFLAIQVFAIAFVSLRIASGVKEVASLTWPVVPGLFPTLGHWCLQALKPFIPAHHALAHTPIFSPEWCTAVWHTLLWFFIIAEVFFVRYFLIEYVGDVAAYIEPYKDSKFDTIRHQIQAIGLDVAKIIYGFGGTTAVPAYERIVFAGHSLGSVLAYDTLNAIINLDLTSATPGSRRVVERTTNLITFGSPLDKTAFLFRNQSNHIADPLREQMSAAIQPLILSYDDYRKPHFWTNLWSHADIISGSLGYYDANQVEESHPLHIQNLPDPAAHIPFYAHVQYWNGELLANTLYNAVK